MSGPHPDLCWWCHSPASALTAALAHEGPYSYLCTRCSERRPRVPTEAIAEDLIEAIRDRLDALCLTSAQRRAVLARVSDRTAQPTLVGEPTP